MDIELVYSLRGQKLTAWQTLLQQAGLTPDMDWETTVLIWEGRDLIAAASRAGNLLKCIAVDDSHQGEGLTATLLTQLRQDAFQAGHSHLFSFRTPSSSVATSASRSLKRCSTPRLRRSTPI